MAPQTINEPNMKYRPNVTPSKNMTEKTTTKIIEIAEAKLLWRLSRYFMTIEM